MTRNNGYERAFSYVQRDPTTPNIANNVGSCCVPLHVAKSLTGFKLCTTTPNNMQQGVQTDAIYVTTNNAGSCWPTIERLAFKFTADCKYEIQVEKLFQNSK